MTTLSTKDRWLLATISGPSAGTLSIPSMAGRHSTRGAGCTTACMTSYSIRVLPTPETHPSLPGAGVRRGPGCGTHPSAQLDRERQPRLRRAQRGVDAVEQAADRLA